MNTNLKALAIGATTLCFAQVGHAGPVGPLTTFAAGTPAKASEVNGNFGVVSAAVNDNASRIGTLETTVTPAGNIVLQPSTATAGNILKGSAPFIHDFGAANTFVGENAGNFTMLGTGNTAVGFHALSSNAGDGSPTPVGGLHNTAIGTGALELNTTGTANTASGYQALNHNTTGGFNTAGGQGALFSNTTGSDNTASGSNALLNSTTGIRNTASGSLALLANITGNTNTASGYQALRSNTTGSGNTAIGSDALFSNTTGTNNIAIGAEAGSDLTTGNGNIAIGNPGVAADSSTIRIGAAQTRAFIAGIRGVTASGGIAVLVDANGQLGTASSSRAVKDDIADMGKASQTLMNLRPVTFHYKNDKSPKGRTLQYGLVAEEVAKVAPGLAARSANGKIETVYYQFLAPMLLNEFQKQQRTIRAQSAEIARQTAKLDQQAIAIAELKQQASRVAELEKQAARMSAMLGRLEREGMIAAAGR